jgi:hypothetical protein
MKKKEKSNVRESKKFSYNEESKVLGIKFIGKQIYTYKNVPKEIFNGLKSCESTGAFFAEHIKDQYECLKHTQG